MSKDHFYFSRNDRIVALLLLLIIVICNVTVISFPGKNPFPDIVSDSLKIVKEKTVSAQNATTEINFDRDSNLVEYRNPVLAPEQRLSGTYKQQPSIPRKKAEYTQIENKHSAKSYAPKKAPLSPVNLNLADSLVLISLPGIGPYYSSRILRYREQLGGYTGVSQLREINGLPDTIMKWFIVTDTVPVKTIRVNMGTIAELRQHPYINFYQARAIVEFRRERGKIKGLEQLSFMEEFTEQDLVRLEPYLDFN